MEHTLTYEETIDNGRIYVMAGCDCGWSWRDNGIVGYNEKDVQMGAQARYREHMEGSGVKEYDAADFTWSNVTGKNVLETWF